MRSSPSHITTVWQVNNHLVHHETVVWMVNRRKPSIRRETHSCCGVMWKSGFEIVDLGVCKLFPRGPKRTHSGWNLLSNLLFLTVLPCKWGWTVWRCCERKQRFLQTNSNIRLRRSLRESINEPVEYSTLYCNVCMCTLIRPLLGVKYTNFVLKCAPKVLVKINLTYSSLN